jgi:multidrug efflux pump
MARNSIGIVLVTGMAIGTVFTLFVVPSVYMAIAARHAREPAHEEAAGPAGNLALA